MANFTMLIGIQGSGKSLYAKGLTGYDRVISSDSIREAVLGDRRDQDHQGLVFEIMNRSVRMLLEEGKDVVYDATNISAKRRMTLLKTLPEGTFKEAIYFDTPIKHAISRDSMRLHVVGENVIMRMYKALDVPMVHEGFDDINYITMGFPRKYEGEYGSFIETDMNSITSYKDYCEFLTGQLEKCIDYAQDNPHHTYSVSKHMYHAMEKVKSEGNSRLTMAAALHDCGKPHCKEFKEDGYACFYGHDKVSAQLAISHMIKLGYNKDDITYISTLINLHMRMHQEGGKDKLLNLIGEEMYKELEILHQADSTAK